MTPHTPVPGLTRDLPKSQEAPNQVRGGVSPTVNATLTPAANPLKSLTPKMRRAWARP